MNIAKVCVPVDVHDLSLPAIREARSLAAASGVTVELLSISSVDDVKITDNALAAVATEIDPSMTWRVVATEHAHAADVEALLVDDLHSNPDTLWCMSSHGRTAFGELLLGSTSSDVVRDAGVPIVVVGPRTEARPDADVVAVALDGSPTSEAILASAQGFAETMGYRLRLLQVGTRHVSSDSTDQGYLISMARSLGDARSIDYEVLFGDADEALTDYVEAAKDVALLAMATRGVPAGARLSVPSTALTVLRHSTVPLLLLHQL